MFTQGRTFRLAVVLLWLAGCVPAQVPVGWESPDIRFDPDDTLICSDLDETNCATPTPFRALMDEAAVGSENETVHYVNLLDIGEEALLLRLHLIRAARNSIYIQQYIWSADTSGLLIFRELVKAARRGVDVKIIGDQLSTMSDAKRVASMVAAHKNLQFKIYNPTFGELETSNVELAVSGLVRLSGVNQRMHNKLMVIDEAIAVLGGRNHEDRYFDLDPRYDFKDRDILVIGATVGDMVFSFREYWAYKYSVPAQYLKDVEPHFVSEDYPIFEVEVPTSLAVRDISRKASDYGHIRRTFVDPAFRVTGQVAFYADMPGKPFEGVEPDPARPIKSSYQGISEVGRDASEELIIQTPYLVVTEKAVDGLKQLRKEHPGLRIVASTNSLASIDHFLAYSFMIKQRKRLLQTLGFRIFEFKPVPGDVREMITRYDRLVEEAGNPAAASADRMPVDVEGPIVGLHGKSIVVDGQIAFVGSHNFDPRSASFNTENAVAIWDRDVARTLKADILRDMEPQNSWVVARQQKLPVISSFTGVIESISRALPVLDLWPFQYSANFDLREGEEPVPPDNPSFYERYANVGQFPNVDKLETVVQTLLIRTMGGFAMPVM
jgi:phosphatidylserine/phosphatidylglycerophosphate/cardiolipin synthase-like enzyme